MLPRFKYAVLWCCLAGALADPASVFPQTTQGSITGKVSSYDGARLEDAIVRFERLSRESLTVQSSGSARTDTGGSYTLPLLTPGIYRLRVEHSGYQPQEVSRLELFVAARLEANFRLRRLADVWGSGTEVALAAGRPSAIIQYYAADVEQLRSSTVQLVPAQTTSRDATLSYVFDGQDIERLPLNGRDLYSALAIQIGATSDTATGRGLGLSINGMCQGRSNIRPLRRSKR